MWQYVKHLKQVIVAETEMYWTNIYKTHHFNLYKQQCMLANAGHREVTQSLLYLQNLRQIEGGSKRWLAGSTQSRCPCITQREIHRPGRVCTEGGL